MEITNLPPFTVERRQEYQKISQAISELRKQQIPLEREIHTRILMVLNFLTATEGCDAENSPVEFNEDYYDLVHCGEPDFSRKDSIYVRVQSIQDANYVEEYFLPLDLVFADDLGDRYTLYCEQQELQKKTEADTLAEVLKQTQYEEYLRLKTIFEKGEEKSGTSEVQM